jgi:hypothetical protein
LSGGKTATKDNGRDQQNEKERSSAWIGVRSFLIGFYSPCRKMRSGVESDLLVDPTNYFLWIGIMSPHPAFVLADQTLVHEINLSVIMFEYKSMSRAALAITPDS